MNEKLAPVIESELEVGELSADLKVKKPSMYVVILINDDFTPMEFVIEVLMKYFGKSAELARLIMLQVHYQGRGVCGVFTREIAETKVTLVNAFARSHEHPLLCTMQIA